MNVLIIEDEVPAAEKIVHYLHKYDPNIEILDKLQGVEESLEWLAARSREVDLIFSDIQLIDGLSFEIFQKLSLEVPVIFTTAYDEYAVDAFRTNSIDYLLKPITFLDLSSALNKFKNVKKSFQNTSEVVRRVKSDIDTQQYKSRFLVKLGDHIHSVKSENVSLFFAEGRTVYLVTSQPRRYIVDFTLEELEKLLKPDLFFRVNRSFILNINSIRDVLVYSNSRLKVSPAIDFDKHIIVSRERVVPFKSWLEGMP